MEKKRFLSRGKGRGKTPALGWGEESDSLLSRRSEAVGEKRKKRETYYDSGGKLSSNLYHWGGRHCHLFRKKKREDYPQRA